MTIATPVTRHANLAGLLDRLGDVPPERIRLDPPPGTATERDLLQVNGRKRGVCELVDGTLVERASGIQEGYLSWWLASALYSYLARNDLGYVIGSQGGFRLSPNLVRHPDVSFVSWERAGQRLVTREPIPSLAPDLAVEILGRGNRPREMRTKLREYFDAGVALVWFVDLKTRSARAFTAIDRAVTIGPDGTLDGGEVLPGFVLPLARLFERLA